MVDQTNKVPSGNAPPGHTAQASSQGRSGGRTEEFKAEARHKTEQAREQARRMADQAKEKGRSMLQEQKGNAAGQINTIAEALRDTARTLEDRNEATAGHWVDKAADGLDRLADGLRERDVDSLIRQAGGLVRRQPALFIGGAVAAGFLLTRFLKAGRPEHESYREGYEGYESYESYAGAGTASSRPASTAGGPLPSRDTGYVTSAHADPGEIGSSRPSVPPVTPTGRRDF